MGKYKMILPPLEISEAAILAQTENWGIARHNVNKVWEMGYTGSGVNIWILDTGVDPEHPDIVVKFAKQFCEDTRPISNSHGTHCATVAAALNNDAGVKGYSFKASILDARVFPGNGVGSLTAVLDACLYIEREFRNIKGRHVISMSLGASKPLKALQVVMDRLAFVHNIPIAVAAGNEGRKSGFNITYPAKWDNNLATGSLSSGDRPSSFSSYGPELQILVAGDGIPGGIIGGGYKMMSGTSMATPGLAGTMALMLEANPNVTTREVYDAILTTAQDLGELGPDVHTGKGVLDAYAAVMKIKNVSKVQGSSVQEELNSIKGDLALVVERLKKIIDTVVSTT